MVTYKTGTVGENAKVLMLRSWEGQIKRFKNKHLEPSGGGACL